MVGVDGDEREVALHLPRTPRGPPRRGRRRSGARSGATTVSASVSEVNVWPVASRPSLQLAVVLDDAVEDDRELGVVAAGQRMRVRLGDGAVRRPARVPEARDRSRSRSGRRAVLQLGERCRRRGRTRARRPRAARSRPSRSRGTRGARARQSSRSSHGLLADVSDDPAHSGLLRPVGRRLRPLKARRARRRPPASSRAVNRAPCSRAPRWYHRAFRASSSSSASASTLTTGSVPLGRTSTRPRPSSSAFDLLDPRRDRRRQLLRRHAARSPSPAGSAASRRPPRTACGRRARRQSSSAATSPSPVTWPSR